jgi:hypothetical protein
MAAAKCISEVRGKSPSIYEIERITSQDKEILEIRE